MGMGDMDAMAQQLSQNPQMMAQIMQVTSPYGLVDI